MNMSLERNADQPYGQSQPIRLEVISEEEHCAINWLKLVALIFMTYGLVAVMWVIR